MDIIQGKIEKEEYYNLEDLPSEVKDVFEILHVRQKKYFQSQY